MVVIRDISSGGFLTDWYQKPISSGRQLNFKSIHPMNQKISTATGLVDRIFKLSDTCFHSKNKTVAFNILRANDYPKNLISRIINRHQHQSTAISTSQVTTTNTSQPLRTFSLPFIPSVSSSIAKSIKGVTDNVRFAYKNHTNVASLFTKLKDKIPPTQESNVVYKVNCLDCPKCYIGTTNQHLCTRMKQHENDVANGKPDKSALAFHSLTHKHKFDFDGVKIVERERNWERRMLLEEIHIKSNKNCVNKRSTESKNVSDIYSSLFSI